jgi:hypothetical protein
VFLRYRMGILFGWWCFEFMDRAAYYRDRAERIRQLADAAWQPGLKEALRRLANDYDQSSRISRRVRPRSATASYCKGDLPVSEANGTDLASRKALR